MRTYETKNWRFEIDDREVRVIGLPIDTSMVHAFIDKREFGEALVGLGIVMSAHVRHAADSGPVEARTFGDVAPGAIAAESPARTDKDTFR